MQEAPDATLTGCYISRWTYRHVVGYHCGKVLGVFCLLCPPLPPFQKQGGCFVQENKVLGW